MKTGNGRKGSMAPSKGKEVDSSEKKRSAVAIVDCRDYEYGRVESALSRALDLLGGIERWVRPGNTVFVKPNMLAAKEPHRAVTTHPLLVEAVVREIQRVGAKALIGDSPAGVLSSIDRYWTNTGFGDVALRTGARLVKLEGAGVSLRTVEGRNYYIASPVAEADVVINLPKLKTHGLTVLSAGVKNTFGVIPGFKKAEYHKQAPKPRPFSEIVVDVYQAVQPALTVLDAVTALEGDGPSTSGVPRDIGLLLAGPDAVSLDAVVGMLVGLREDQVPSTAAALRRGVGVGLAGCEVLGGSIKEWVVPDFRLASSRLIHMTPKWVVTLLGRYIWVRPHVLKEQCTACGLCIETCAVEAMAEGRGGVPTIDYDKCIECLACIESCPAEAIEQKVSWLARRFT
jgi:uncharacterized protein (DUF362 family)/NAD-dependent dihydropyrimidine dehydrogenase PreA subunit